MAETPLFQGLYKLKIPIDIFVKIKYLPMISRSRDFGILRRKLARDSFLASAMDSRRKTVKIRNSRFAGNSQLFFGIARRIVRRHFNFDSYI